MNGPGDFPDNRDHRAGATVVTHDGRFVIPCEGCRRPWPCADWHAKEARHHLECARRKATQVRYPEVTS